MYDVHMITTQAIDQISEIHQARWKALRPGVHVRSEWLTVIKRPSGWQVGTTFDGRLTPFRPFFRTLKGAKQFADSQF